MEIAILVSVMCALSVAAFVVTARMDYVRCNKPKQAVSATCVHIPYYLKQEMDLTFDMADLEEVVKMPPPGLSGLSVKLQASDEQLLLLEANGFGGLALFGFLKTEALEELISVGDANTAKCKLVYVDRVIAGFNIYSVWKEG